MYNQIIPKTYINDATKQNLKSLIQAIYLANRFSPFEKRVLTELSLYPLGNPSFKKKHIGVYKRYKKKYHLYDDFRAATSQVLQAINSEAANEEYWASIPHPHNHNHMMEDLYQEEVIIH